MLRTLVLTAALVLAAGTFAPEAQAQMSKDDIIKGLKPSQPVTRSVRTRAIEVIPGKEAEVIDLMEALKRSLGGGERRRAPARASGRAATSASKKSSARKAPAKKRA